MSMTDAAPITPPMSPGHSEHADIGMEDNNDVDDLSMDVEEIEGEVNGEMVDVITHYGGSEAVKGNTALSPVPSSTMQPRRSREAIDISRVREAQALSRPMGGPEGHRPLKLLEDEEVHLQKSGIKLTDFEVRGTLGELDQ